MVKTTSQIRNIVEDWCKTVNITLEDNTTKANEKNDVFDFYLNGGVEGNKYAISKNKNRDDRITLSTSVNISPVHLEAMAGISDKERAELLQSINELAIVSGCTIQWSVKDGQPVGFVVTDWVDTEEFDRPKFYHRLDTVMQVKVSSVAKIQIKLNPSVSATDVSNTDSDSNPMYR